MSDSSLVEHWGITEDSTAVVGTMSFDSVYNYNRFAVRMTPDRYPVQVIGALVLVDDTAEFDFVSRYFAPWVGIDEDPVTGSPHCVSGPYWAKRLGKNELFARQVSARGGDLWLKVMGDRIKIAGEAVLVMEGTLYL